MYEDNCFELDPDNFEFFFSLFSKENLKKKIIEHFNSLFSNVLFEEIEQEDSDPQQKLLALEPKLEEIKMSEVVKIKGFNFVLQR